MTRLSVTHPGFGTPPKKLFVSFCILTAVSVATWEEESGIGERCHLQWVLPFPRRHKPLGGMVKLSLALLARDRHPFELFRPFGRKGQSRCQTRRVPQE